MNAGPIRFAQKPQQVLVTGGTGFVGQHLVRALLAEGHQVIVLTRRPSHAAELFAGRVQVCGSLDEISSMSAIDVVVNLAGARILGLPWSAARKQALLRSRVALTQNLVAWIAKLDPKPRVLLSASAIGYYGIQPQGDDTALSEDSPPQPIFMSQLCQSWEQAAAAATQSAVQVVSLRFGLVLGHGGALPMMLLPVRLGLGGRLGTGRQWVSWVHIHDLLRAIAHACQAGGNAFFRAYNVTAPEQVHQLEFSKTAARILRRPCFLPTPGLPLRMVLGEQADLLLEGQRVHPSRLLEEGFVFSYSTLEAALADLCLRTR